MSNRSKQRKENRYKEEEEPKKDFSSVNNFKPEDYKQANDLDGGLSDDLTIEDIAKIHDADLNDMVKQLKMGIKVEYEHTRDKTIATEIALDHLYEIPDYYTRLAKMEKEAKGEGKVEGDVDESMDASGSGQFSAPMGQPIKRPIYNIPTMNESAPESSGQYDMPAFVGTSKDPLKIAGVKAIGKRAKTINKTKSFPKFGGPDAVFVKIKDKCKKFPYCNQSPEAIEIMKEEIEHIVAGVRSSIKHNEELKNAINEVSKKRGIPYKELEKLVINEIKVIFI